MKPDEHNSRIYAIRKRALPAVRVYNMHKKLTFKVRLYDTLQLRCSLKQLEYVRRAFSIIPSLIWKLNKTTNFILYLAVVKKQLADTAPDVYSHINSSMSAIIKFHKNSFEVSCTRKCPAVSFILICDLDLKSDG